MGLFGSLFGKTIKIEHDFFGTMIFNGGKVPNPTDYYECRRHFKPSDDIIEIGIDGDLFGPTEGQILFFKAIEDNYKQITKAITPLLEDEFRNFREDFKIINFDKEFVPVYLKLPLCESTPFIWEIAFESDHDRDHTFTVTMIDFEAKEVLIDG
jgi:hypothetical protein